MWALGASFGMADAVTTAGINRLRTLINKELWSGFGHAVDC